MPRVTITVPDKTSQPYRFQLDTESVTIGRGSDNDIAINCTSISGKHAEMRRVPGGYELHDLGSTNGIKIGGERHRVVQLRNGIPIKLGDVSFDFLLSEDELAELEFEKSETKAAEKPTPDDDTPKFPTLPDSPVEAKDSQSEPEKSPARNSSSNGCVMILLFLILATAAFVAGMEIRSRKDTGDSLIDSLKAIFAVEPNPANGKAAPDQPEP